MKNKKHLLVIGGTSGIGLEYIKKVNKKFKITVFGRNKKNLEILKKKFSSVNCYACDVRDNKKLNHSFKKAVSIFGRIDILLYSAGIQILKPHRIMNNEDFELCYSTNLGGALNSSNIFLSNKISNEKSVFCVISSISSFLSEPGLVSYSVSKSGLNTMIKGLARECAPRRFVGLAPGWLKTNMTENQKFYNNQIISIIKKKSPLGLIEMKDVLNLISFLTSSKAKKITGQIIRVDGGFSV